MTVMDKPILFVEDIAKILGISINTIQSKNWQKRSGCPLYKRGKRLTSLSSEFWKWYKKGRRY